MRASELLMPTLREVPAEAEVISHQLLLRAGFIRKSTAGVYTFLPLGMRVLRKIMRIIREEMEREGGQELLMPIIQPAELWQESGRWDVYGPELFRLKDRHGRDFCLGPTHEEMITALVRGEVSSYKQLPLYLYQIQNKYRDERRPRFGLMRGREFIMKDLYTFDRDEDGMAAAYRKMFDAYCRIFERCGLTFRPVEADAGAIGGSDTHEFMVLAESGEATLLFCSACEYASNVEKAALPPAVPPEDRPSQPICKVETPGRRTVMEVVDFLGIRPQDLIKTLLYRTDQGVIAALVRGDRDVNEVKLQNVLGCLRLELADADAIRAITGADVGYAGPVGLGETRIVADLEVASLVNAVTGANENGRHYLNVNPGRDFTFSFAADIRIVRAGEPCPRCAAALEEARGIEVGQVFKLGTKYSQKLGATYLDENGRSRPVVMSTCGIGVTRTMAATVEQNHDADGIIWPAAVAPFQAVVVPVSIKDSDQVSLAEDIYKRFLAEGIEAVLDDRPERAGVKFKDADLIGYPVRVVIGTKAVTDKQLEVRLRRTGEVTVIPLERITGAVKILLKEA
ncbi:MAG: proline--tRNA ligase [Peptococcaceae bacterium]|nr:MAG: proline--tRNA ligase [Peptococcaceae bacterium]